MRTVIVGHRGTGKSSLLERIRKYYGDENRGGLFFDLDSEIEKRSGQKIDELFAQGEGYFRRAELETFHAIERELDKEEDLDPGSGTPCDSSFHEDVFVVAGAGFDVSAISNAWRVLWARRVTDADGRVFFDRPRLNVELSPLREYMARLREREERFRIRADDTLWLGEGMDDMPCDGAERDYFIDRVTDLRGALTLLPSHFLRRDSLVRRLRARVRWGVSWFELRDDLLTEEEMEFALGQLPAARVLVSFRSPSRKNTTRAVVVSRGLAFDWPMEFGAWNAFIPEREPKILSLHERPAGTSLAAAFSRFPSELPQGTQLKVALPIADFIELKEAHAWQSAQAANRILLPLSPDGRWAWYRLLQGRDFALNFFREDEGSGADQPTILEWARCGAAPRLSEGCCFAAVLGDPVAHSRTPMEQRAFFERHQAPVFSIRMTEKEWRSGALEFLRMLGLRWAAITSPLKGIAFETSRCVDALSAELKAVNTLKWSAPDAEWLGANTDIAGLKIAADEAKPPGPVAVWGGGGTLAVIQKVIPDAQMFSSRTGENRLPGGVRAGEFNPRTVIWAVGRSRDGGESALPASWRPQLVFDLNYADDSPGREYALAQRCRYFSGRSMFKAQAAAQRSFWSE